MATINDKAKTNVNVACAYRRGNGFSGKHVSW